MYVHEVWLWGLHHPALESGVAYEANPGARAVRQAHIIRAQDDSHVLGLVDEKPILKATNLGSQTKRNVATVSPSQRGMSRVCGGGGVGSDGRAPSFWRRIS